MYGDTMKALAEIYQRHRFPQGKPYVTGAGGDKGDPHRYLEVYEKLFAGHRESAKYVLEVGVGRGYSLGMWAEYFLAAEIHGIDIAPRCRAVRGRRIRIHICNSTDLAAVNRCLPGVEFEIVIDDGSHEIADQIKTFTNLWPRVAAGGIYVIEDIHEIDKNRSRLLAMAPEVEILDRRTIAKGDVQIVVHKPEGK